MSPLERYQRDLQAGLLLSDSAQYKAVECLQALYERMLEPQVEPLANGRKIEHLIGRLTKSRVKVKVPVKGLYFWGGVGRGKTYLMDLFYDSLPFGNKMRVHFHRFMQRVHKDLTALSGQKNPLDIIAKRIANQTRIICFDEFFVSDITDAMILGGLFERLFGHGITLVATSNIEPDNLYKDGLQRQRFLPVIALLKEHTQVINVDSGIDYRLRVLEQAELYHSPLDAEADQSLSNSFNSLVSGSGIESGAENQRIEIEGRWLQSRKSADGVVWFDFSELCDGPRSQNDYIELARLYYAVLVSNVPRMGAEKDDQARRFINMVDEFYDRNVKLVMSAEVGIDQLYAGGRLEFEFARTRSRLLEMQSHDYLAREHFP